jgi:hypothetical protein
MLGRFFALDERSGVVAFLFLLEERSGDMNDEGQERSGDIMMLVLAMMM